MKVMLNGHPIKDWSVTQTVLATSSAEAEYYGIARGTSIGIGIVKGRRSKPSRGGGGAPGG